MGIENNIPVGWTKTTLGDVCENISRRFNFQDKETVVFVNTGDVSNGKFLHHNKISKEGLPGQAKKAIKIGDILYSEIRPKNKRFAIVDFDSQDYVVSTKFMVLKRNDKIDLDFFYLFLKSNKTINAFQSHAEARSGTFPQITFDTISLDEIILPPLSEQKAIAKVLNAFDDKIELLQAQNKTLETMAQTIFKEWFGKYQVGDELPLGWRVGVIGDLIEIKRGGSPRPIKDYISDSGYRWLKISDASATSSPYIFIIKEHIKKEGLKKTTLKHKGDLVLSNSATPGIPKFLAVDTCVHDGWMHFPSAKVSNEYLYLLFLNIRPKLVQQGSGSVFVNLKTDTLRQFETIIASKNDFEAFDNLIKPIFTKIYNNALQIQSLTKTRDTLLPKLMSGQVRVNNLKQTVDA